MGSALDLGGELVGRKRADARGLVRIDHQHQARAQSGSGTSVNGPVPVWNSVELSWCGRWWRRLKVSAVCG